MSGSGSTLFAAGPRLRDARRIAGDVQAADLSGGRRRGPWSSAVWFETRLSAPAIGPKALTGYRSLKAITAATDFKENSCGHHRSPHQARGGQQRTAAGFCSVTFDDAFVVRDLKIIEGTKGSFVAMPSRKLTDRCTACGSKNHLRARFCNPCGHRLDENRAIRDADGRAKLHADIAHPINSACREVIQSAVLKAYQEERERAKQPGYVCTYDDYDGDDFDVPSYGGETRRGTVRAHGGHGARGNHMQTNEAPAGRDDRRPDFGAGIY